ncbi:MAG: hypothetical protein M3220_18210 [Chloroflexota bacterium]|nr:hypothetical protein [Chloroflexota bacterium]
MKVKNVSNQAIEGDVTLHSHDGDVVVKGVQGRAEGKFIGEVEIERRDDGTEIHSVGSVILTLPADRALTLHGAPVNTVVKGLREVTVEECHGNCVVSQVGSLNLSGNVHGDAVLREIDGDLLLESIHGDLVVHEAGQVQLSIVHGDAALHQVGEVTIGLVSGDLSISRAEGIRVEHVSGDATLSHISGAASLDDVMGDLSVNAPGPSLTASRVGGDVALAGTLQPGGEYSIYAGGDVRMQVEGNIHFTVRGEGELEVGTGLEQEEGDDGAVHVYLGEREEAAHVLIEAMGDVYLNTERHGRRRRHPRPPRIDIDPEVRRAMREAHGEVQRARAEIKAEMRRVKHTIRNEVKRALDEADSAGLNGEAIGESVRTAVQELLSALRPPAPGAPASPPAPPAPPPPASTPSEELRTILRMVEEGTITPEEAERLIAAMK